MHRRSSNLCNNSVYSGGSCLLNAIVGAVSSSTALTSRGCCTGVWESTARLLRLVDSIQAKRRGGGGIQAAGRGAGSRRLTAQVRVLPEGWARCSAPGNPGATVRTRSTEARGAARDARGGVAGIERVCEEGRRGCGARNPRLIDSVH